MSPMLEPNVFRIRQNFSLSVRFQTDFLREETHTWVCDKNMDLVDKTLFLDYYLFACNHTDNRRRYE